jgi:hypothetical protein
MSVLYIDGSHLSNHEFMERVIRFAGDAGFDNVDWDTFDSDMAILHTTDDLEFINDVDWELGWTFDQAMDYLNDTCPDGSVYAIMESSLYLLDTEDEDVY